MSAHLGHLAALTAQPVSFFRPQACSSPRAWHEAKTACELMPCPGVCCRVRSVEGGRKIHVDADVATLGGPLAARGRALFIAPRQGGASAAALDTKGAGTGAAGQGAQGASEQQQQQQLRHAPRGTPADV